MDHQSEDRGTPAPSRRTFLRRAGVGAASAAVGAGLVGAGAAYDRSVHDARYGFTPLPARPEPGFDHVVVMFENRSFDHVLGRLYTDADLRPGQSFAGLQDGRHENTAPDGTVVPAHVYEGTTDHVMSQPDPDPGEFYPHVNTQWFGLVEPAENADRHGTGTRRRSTPLRRRAHRRCPGSSTSAEECFIHRDPSPTRASLPRGAGSSDFVL